MYVSTVVKNTMLETGGYRDAVFGTVHMLTNNTPYTIFDMCSDCVSRATVTCVTKCG